MSASDRGSLEGVFAPVRAELGHPVSELRADAQPESRQQPEIRVVTHAEPIGVHNVAVYLPIALRDAVRDRARGRGLTITQVVEEAFAEHGSNYGELVGLAAEVPGAMPTRISARRGGGTIQVQLRLDQRQHEWLDSQVERFGAPNRSALVSAVLTRHLGDPQG